MNARLAAVTQWWPWRRGAREDAGPLPVRDNIEIGGSRPVRLSAFDQPLVAVVGILAAGAGIVIGLAPPAQFKEGPPMTYAILLIAGVALLALPPQLSYQFRRPQWRKPATTAVAETKA